MEQIDSIYPNYSCTRCRLAKFVSPFLQALGIEMIGIGTILELAVALRYRDYRYRYERSIYARPSESGMYRAAPINMRTISARSLSPAPANS